MSTELSLSVLGYVEDGEWIALALEMDLRGYGKTFEDAQTELMDLVQAQFSFAAFKGQPELVWHSSDRKYWKMFEDTKRTGIQNFSLGTKTTPPHRVTGMPVPPAHVIAELAKEPLVEA